MTDFSINHFLSKDSAEYELLLFDCLSTPSMRLYSEGSTVTRFKKIEALADYPIARRHLFSCAFSGENCGRCEKCTRNLLSLDLLGKLDQFSKVYDIDFYKSHRARYINYLYINRKDHYFEELYGLFMERGDADLRQVRGFMKLVKRFDALWGMDQPDSDRKAVALLSPYESENYRAAIRMAKAYETGRGVLPSEERRRACLELVADHYREEVSSGFEMSRIGLFDALWKLNDPDSYGEMLSVLYPLARIERPRACVRIARMYMEGRGVEKDPDSAVEWMRKSPASRNKFALEYCGMLLATDSEENHAEAVDLCIERFDETGDPELCVLISGILSEGKGSVRDMDAAVDWMRKAYAAQPNTYCWQYADILMKSGRDIDFYEVINVCFKLYDRHGSSKACEVISDIYRLGRGVEKDTNAAVAWMGKAAELEPVKYVRRYESVLDAAGAPRYYAEAAGMCRSRLEDGGSPAFSALLARLCRDGRGVEKDLGEAVRLMRAAYKWRPQWYAKEYVGILLESGDEFGVAEAARVVGSDLGLVDDPAHCSAIGDAYRLGKGVEKDLDKAVAWMGKAESKDSRYLGDYCDLLMSIGDQKSYAEVLRACRKDAKKRAAPESMAIIARLYRDGRGVEKNMKESVAWMRGAMAQDPDKYRSEFVGILFESGRDQDVEEAAGLCKGRYDQVADPGMCAKISHLYHEGKGVGADQEEAVDWMRRAMSLDPDGYSEAYYSLVAKTGPVGLDGFLDECKASYESTGFASYALIIASIYRDGNGVPKDPDLAARWMEKAVFTDPPGDFLGYCRFMESLGDPYAIAAVERCERHYDETKDKAVCKTISEMYRTGTGVKKDIRKASEWMGRCWGV